MRADRIRGREMRGGRGCEGRGGMEQMGGRRERGEIGGRVTIFVRAKCAPLREEGIETNGRGGVG